MQKFISAGYKKTKYQCLKLAKNLTKFSVIAKYDIVCLLNITSMNLLSKLA